MNRIYSLSSTLINMDGMDDVLPNFVSINYDANNNNVNLSEWKLFANEDNSNSSNCGLVFNTTNNIFGKFNDFEELYTDEAVNNNQCNEMLIKTDLDFEEAEEYYHTFIDDMSIKFDVVNDNKLSYELLYSAKLQNYISPKYGISFKGEASECNEIRMRRNDHMKMYYNIGVGVLINMIHTGYYRQIVYSFYYFLLFSFF